MKGLQIIQSIVRMLVGVMFIVAAVLKLLSIDNFEIYIFSFQFLSLSLTAIAARCIIAFEMLLGIALLFKFFYKQTWWTSMLMMIGFTVFLVIVAIFRNDANCHCFGDLIPITPISSIFKNLFIIALLFFIKNPKQPRIGIKNKKDESEKSHFQLFAWEDYSKKFKTWSITASSIVTLLVCFILFPPNYFLNKLFSKNEYVMTQIYEQAYTDSSFYLQLNDIQYDKIKDTVTFNKDTGRLSMDNGRYVVAVYSSGCKYCKQSSELLRTIFERNNLDPMQLKVLIWGSDPSISKFIKETKTNAYEFRKISPFLALDMVHGSFPTLILIENGEIVEGFDYRGISENRIVGFISEGK